MRIALLIILLCTVAIGQVPYANNSSFSRTEQTDPPWHIRNYETNSILFQNGVQQVGGTESGTNDMQMEQVWKIHNRAVKVGVLSDGGIHGPRVIDCVRQVSPLSEIYVHPTPRWYAGQIADGILDCEVNGCKVVVVPGGYGEQDAYLQIALTVCPVIVVFAAPDTAVNLDGPSTQFPYLGQFPNVLYANASGRNGEYVFGATGTNCIAAPGWRIVANGTYGNGCSYSAPLLAGFAAILWDYHPLLTPDRVIELMRLTATPAGPLLRLNPLAAMLWRSPARRKPANSLETTNE